MLINNCLSNYIRDRLLAGFLLLGLLALVRTATAAEAPPVQFTVDKFLISGENPIPDDLAQSALAAFIGKHEGLDALLAAAAELESVILQAGYSFHRVVLPPQTIDNGTISLKVIVYKLANVAVSGNKHFSDKNIIASLPGLKPGQNPDTRQLSQDLIVANDHPSKEVTIRIKRSKKPDSLDAELVVQDERPWQLFTTLNNIGTDETGEFRISAGYQNTNLLNFDDTLTLSYTTSPGHIGDVKQYGFNYRIPLYMFSSSLSFYYSRSDVDSGTIAQVFDVSGAGKFFGGSYTYTFMDIGKYRHRLSLGVDDKLFENDIDFLGVPLGVDIRSRPLNLVYSGEWRFERSNLNHQIIYSRNLPGGSNNDGASYAAARLGAKHSWESLRFKLQGYYSLNNGWLATAAVNGQYTNEPLISGEQFGLGGINSIRGFEERGVTGDRGVRFTLEAWTPSLKYNIRLLGFMDAGYVKTVDVPPGQLDSDSLVSLGLGLRWHWNNKLSVNLDYGHELNGARTANAGGAKLHFSAFYRF